VTGGLGKLMQEYLFESWLCYRDHECSSSENFMCWIFDEKDEIWLPWATNFDLELYPVSESAVRSLDEHKRISQQVGRNISRVRLSACRFVVLIRALSFAGNKCLQKSKGRDNFQILDDGF